VTNTALTVAKQLSSFRLLLVAAAFHMFFMLQYSFLLLVTWRIIWKTIDI